MRPTPIKDEIYESNNRAKYLAERNKEIEQELIKKGYRYERDDTTVIPTFVLRKPENQKHKKRRSCKNKK